MVIRMLAGGRGLRFLLDMAHNKYGKHRQFVMVIVTASVFVLWKLIGLEVVTLLNIVMVPLVVELLSRANSLIAVELACVSFEFHDAARVNVMLAAAADVVMPVVARVELMIEKKLPSAVCVALVAAASVPSIIHWMSGWVAEAIAFKANDRPMYVTTFLDFPLPTISPERASLS